MKQKILKLIEDKISLESEMRKKFEKEHRVWIKKSESCSHSCKARVHYFAGLGKLRGKIEQLEELKEEISEKV